MRRSRFGRLQVWNHATDPYKHTDLGYNFDTLDRMIGGQSQTDGYGIGETDFSPSTPAPSGTAQWLFPQDGTQIPGYGNRTLYNIVRALSDTSAPLGTVITWWRPDVSIPVPTGWAICDGSSVVFANHSYGAGIGTITLPDLRNKFVMGATNAAAIGTTGGSNTHDLTHTHDLQAHTHTFPHTHTTPAHHHGMDHKHRFIFAATEADALAADGGDNGAIWDHSTGPMWDAYNTSGQTPGTAAGPVGVPTGSSFVTTYFHHTHNFRGYTSRAGLDPDNPMTTGPRATTDSDGAAATGAASPGSTAGPSTNTTGAASPSLAAVDIRPAYFGLLYIILIKKPTNLYS